MPGKVAPSTDNNNYEMDPKSRERKRKRNYSDEIKELKEQLKQMHSMIARLKDDNVNIKTGSISVTYMNYMADNVAVVGLREALTWNHRILKAIWVLLILLGFLATSYYIYKGIGEFLNNESATKISLVKSPSYEFPPLAVCPPWWFDSQTIKSLGLKRDELAFSLGYANFIDTYFANDFEKAAKDIASDDNFSNETAFSYLIKSARSRFLDFYKTHNFTSVPEYYKAIASNISDYETCINDSCVMQLVNCQGCNVSSSVQQKVFSNSICFVFSLSRATPKSRDEPIWLQLASRDFTAGMLDGARGTWLVDFEPNVGTKGPSIELKPFSTSHLKITPQRIILLPNESSCVDTSIEKNKGHDQKLCTEICVNNATDFRGTALEGLRTFAVTDEISRIYNSYEVEVRFTLQDDLRNGTTTFQTLYANLTSDEAIDLEEQLLLSCYAKCLPSCDRFLYDITVEHTGSSLKTEQNTSAVKIYFQHGAVLQDGIVTWREVPTTTFTEFVSNVGGTLGLFLGCTIMTLAQLILSVVNYALNERDPTRRKCDPVPMPNNLKSRV